MKKQDNNTINGNSSFESNEGQLVYLSCNDTSSRSPSLPSNHFSSETIESLEELGGVLQTIHVRMRKEGYNVVNDSIIKIDENDD